LNSPFEWDRTKARSNLWAHGVSFEEATTVFTDSFSLTIPDPDHSLEEDRFVILGQSETGALLVVVHSERQGRIRIISARQATRHERVTYEEDQR
jgi:hypothetical protein